jgi:hypothetical protein
LGVVDPVRLSLIESVERLDVLEEEVAVRTRRGTSRDLSHSCLNARRKCPRCSWVAVDVAYGSENRRSSKGRRGDCERGSGDHRNYGSTPQETRVTQCIRHGGEARCAYTPPRDAPGSTWVFSGNPLAEVPCSPERLDHQYRRLRVLEPRLDDTERLVSAPNGIVSPMSQFGTAAFRTGGSVGIPSSCSSLKPPPRGRSHGSAASTCSG